MRDYSIVSARFWTGKTGFELRGQPDAALLALYLISGPESTMTGLYRLPMGAIEFGLAMDQEGASKALRRVIQTGFARYDAEHGVIFVPQMARWQLGESFKAGDKRIQGVRKQIEPFRNSPLFADFLKIYNGPYHLGMSVDDATRSPFEGASMPLRSPFEGACAQEQDQEQHSGTGIRNQDQQQQHDKNAEDAAAVFVDEGEGGKVEDEAVIAELTAAGVDRATHAKLARTPGITPSAIRVLTLRALAFPNGNNAAGWTVKQLINRSLPTDVAPNEIASWWQQVQSVNGHQLTERPHADASGIHLTEAGKARMIPRHQLTVERITFKPPGDRIVCPPPPPKPSAALLRMRAALGVESEYGKGQFEQPGGIAVKRLNAPYTAASSTAEATADSGGGG